MSIKEELDPFFDADSVAVVGASRTTGPAAFNAVENMIEFGYDGDIYPVNPKADEILGRKAYDDIGEIEEKVEHALIIIPRKIVPNTVEGCVENGIPAVTIATQGFAEVGGEGKELQEKLVEIVEGTDTRIVGPNTLGTHNLVDNFTMSFIPFKQRDYKPIGMVSQTGLWSASVSGLPYAKELDIGNACDVDHVDALRYYKQDSDVEQIFMHMEGLDPSRGRELLNVAKETIEEEGKSVIILKSGWSEAGSEHAASHVGALAGESKIFDGAFKQSGIVRVKNSRGGEIASKALLELPGMSGNRIGMITHHGASGTLAIDWCEEHDLELPELSNETIKTLEEISPDWLGIGNPLDIWPALMGGPEKTHRAIIEAVLEDENADGILLSLHIADPTTWDLGVYGHIDALKDLVPQYDKPVIVYPVGTEQGETRKELAKIENVSVADSIEDAMRSFHILYRSGKGEK
ncbi:hypothetical protein AKJ66_01020 [candidate division MSBL1 archaeon SCGC-AAA259E22]|uniref:acetate--CoA ligase (ADP-forming) n=1 Tax=candidate division MSBL1 archaeon SCGC-AAA259E22 TaxID=1698265 RepID=A0A133UHT6_9EURY|nr:hypothetical protein AKJ66_01020 [candidate division MSBL1 archaeon SCGC-AAA259E22]